MFHSMAHSLNRLRTVIEERERDSEGDQDDNGPTEGPLPTLVKTVKPDQHEARKETTPPCSADLHRARLKSPAIRYLILARRFLAGRYRSTE